MNKVEVPEPPTKMYKGFLVEDSFMINSSTEPPIMTYKGFPVEDAFMINQTTKPHDLHNNPNVSDQNPPSDATNVLAFASVQAAPDQQIENSTPIFDKDNFRIMLKDIKSF